MNVVSIGRHFVAVTTANNFMGNGFYQFGPELYYRILSEENGFLVEEMILVGVIGAVRGTGSPIQTS
jgi:hypothetical protein